uniref:SLP adaptor and CSK interacting membrane protein n=1 Tax=Ursus americanus TaxID=9643 RepID=A0A452QJC0_URSAM
MDWWRDNFWIILAVAIVLVSTSLGLILYCACRQLLRQGKKWEIAKPWKEKQRDEEKMYEDPTAYVVALLHPSWSAQCQHLGSLGAQSVKHPTFDFSSGHDLGVLGSSPTLGSLLNVESACPSPSLFSPPPPLSLSLSNKPNLFFSMSAPQRVPFCSPSVK